MKKVLSVLVAALAIVAIAGQAQAQPVAYKATISWAAPTSGGAPDSYIVERTLNTVPLNWTTVGTVLVPALSFVDTGLPPSTAYCWRVSAHNASGTGVPSSSACATTPTPLAVPGAPTNIQVIISQAP